MFHVKHFVESGIYSFAGLYVVIHEKLCYLSF